MQLRQYCKFSLVLALLTGRADAMEYRLCSLQGVKANLQLARAADRKYAASYLRPLSASDETLRWRRHGGSGGGPRLRPSASASFSYFSELYDYGSVRFRCAAGDDCATALLAERAFYSAWTRGIYELFDRGERLECLLAPGVCYII